VARIRSIKPGFFTSEDVSVLPLRARLTWIGLWTHCDDHGRAKDNTRLIKAALWALDDVSLKDVEEDLVILANCGRITRYQSGGQNYLAVTNWPAHQHPNRPIKSVLPPPPGPPRTEDARRTHGGRTPGGEGRGTEGRGEELARTSDRQPRKPRAPSTSDQRVSAAMDLAADYEARGL
jgi:hypothetical protein